MPKNRVGRAVAERIGEIIRRARKAMEPPMSQSVLGDRVGVTKGAVSAWESRGVIPKAKHAQAIAMTLNIPLHWISGDPSRANVAPLSDATERRFVPKIDWVSAGRGAAAVDPYPAGVGVDYVEVSAKYSDETFALEVRGTSMEPRFKEGDTIIVDPSQRHTLKAGDFVIVELLPAGTPAGQGAVTFKQYMPRGTTLSGGAVYDLVPLNPEDATITVHRANPGRLIGKVVEHRATL